jgi:hypothetical protein
MREMAQMNAAGDDKAVLRILEKEVLEQQRSSEPGPAVELGFVANAVNRLNGSASTIRRQSGGKHQRACGRPQHDLAKINANLQRQQAGIQVAAQPSYVDNRSVAINARSLAVDARSVNVDNRSVNQMVDARSATVQQIVDSRSLANFVNVRTAAPSPPGGITSGPVRRRSGERRFPSRAPKRGRSRRPQSSIEWRRRLRHHLRRPLPQGRSAAGNQGRVSQGACAVDCPGSAQGTAKEQRRAGGSQAGQGQVE